MRKLLVILAHPDDESFGPGGTLAKYAASGLAVHYLCGTRGEAGTVDARLLNGFRDVAELRTAELMRAAEALGLASVRFLGYRDSGMACADDAPSHTLCAAPLDEVAQRIAGFLDQLRPDAVITHDRFGGYDALLVILMVMMGLSALAMATLGRPKRDWGAGGGEG